MTYTVMAQIGMAYIVMASQLRWGYSPLHYAATTAHTEIYELLQARL